MTRLLGVCGAAGAMVTVGCDQGAGGQSPAPAPAKSTPATPTDPKSDPKATPTPPKSDAPKSEAPKSEPDPMTTPANPTLPAENVTIGGK